MINLQEKRKIFRDFLLFFILFTSFNVYFLGNVSIPIFSGIYMLTILYIIFKVGITNPYDLNNGVVFFIFILNFRLLYYTLTFKLYPPIKISILLLLMFIFIYFLLKQRTLKRYSKVFNKSKLIGNHIYKNKIKLELKSDIDKFLHKCRNSDSYFPFYLYIKIFVKSRKLNKDIFRDNEWENEKHSEVYNKIIKIFQALIKRNKSKKEKYINQLNKFYKNANRKNECDKCKSVKYKSNMNYEYEQFVGYWVCQSCNQDHQVQNQSNLEEFKQKLGITGKATIDKIETAYREKVKKHHPDVGGDTEKFKEIQQAYEKLKQNNSKI